MVVHFQLIEETKSWSSFFLSQIEFPSSLISEDVQLRQVFGLFGVQFRQVSL
jgi:hypothetical protein